VKGVGIKGVADDKVPKEPLHLQAAGIKGVTGRKGQERTIQAVGMLLLLRYRGSIRLF
jgi:hypothetical protein